MLLRLNLSEIRYFIDETLNKSTRRDILRQALFDCILINQERPFDLPWWQKLFWSLIFAVILLIATGGNIIVMWIVLGKKTDCNDCINDCIACSRSFCFIKLRIPMLNIDYFKIKLFETKIFIILQVTIYYEYIFLWVYLLHVAFLCNQQFNFLLSCRKCAN